MLERMENNLKFFTKKDQEQLECNPNVLNFKEKNHKGFYQIYIKR